MGGYRRPGADSTLRALQGPGVAYPKGPSNGIVYILGAKIPTIMVLGPFGLMRLGATLDSVGCEYFFL